MLRNNHFKSSHFKARHLQLGIFDQVIQYVIARAGFCHDAIINSFHAIPPVNIIARLAVNRLFDKGYAPVKELLREATEDDLTKDANLTNLAVRDANMEIRREDERVPEEIGSRSGIFEYLKYLGNVTFDRIRTWL